MTQTPQEKQKQPTRWFVPFPEKKAITGHPCRDACNGNAKQGELLLYFLYEASWELDWQGLDKSCKVVKFTRSHKDILKRVNISEKTLVQFLKQFTIWGFVLSESYGKVFTIQAEPIHQAMYFPIFTKKLRQKSCTSTSEEGTTSDGAQESCNVYLLQQKVEALEQVQLYNIALEARVQALSEAWQQESCKVVKLQENVEQGKLYNSALSAWIEAVSQTLQIPSPIDSIREIESIDYSREYGDVPFVTSPSSSSEQPPSPSYSQDSYTQTDVTQASQESESPTHGHTPPALGLPGDDCRGTVGTQHPLSAGADIPVEAAREAPGMGVRGYEKGVGDEPGTDDIWDRDAGGARRDTPLHPAPDQHCVGDPQEQAVQAAQEVIQQTPLSQGLAPALDGDARERSTPPVATALLLSHTLQGTSLLGEMSLDALLSQPQCRIDVKALLSQLRGQPTRMTQGEPIRAGDTSSDATSQPMKPVSQNKTVQGKENKKPRRKVAKPEKPVVPVEPAPDPLTVEERELFDAWNSIFEAEVPLGPVTIETVQWLNKPVHTWARLLELSLKETLDDMRKSCYAKDKKDYFKKNGVRLYNLKDNFEGWQSAKQEELRKKREQEKSSGGSGEPRKVGDYYFYQPEIRKTREAAPIYPQVAASAPTSIAYHS